MKIFVPRFRHDLPSENGHILNEMFVEIDEMDLRRVTDFWCSLDRLSKLKARDFFKSNANDLCSIPPKDGTLEPYLRRPHITVHCGAKEGSPEIRELARNVVYQIGYLAAKYGFNVWYGGGDTGLMGWANRGFLAGIEEHRYPDQYSVQVMPARFVFADAVPDRNGLRPANEGLGGNTDIAIIMPDFVGRRELLGNKCAAAIAALGGIGTMDESTDIWVHIKTGLRTMPSYMVNTFFPLIGRGCWDSILQQINDCIKLGTEKQKVFENIHFLPTPENCFEHLMKHLDEIGQNPHTVYQEYCREHNIKSDGECVSMAPAVVLAR